MSISRPLKKDEYPGQAPLYAAVVLENTQIVHLLLEAGADPNIPAELAWILRPMLPNARGRTIPNHSRNNLDQGVSSNLT